MARSKPSKQLSQAEIECFLVAAEALHRSIIRPFLSPYLCREPCPLCLVLAGRNSPSAHRRRYLGSLRCSTRAAPHNKT
ncbi:MAG: hypothetical protein EOR46_30700 [Mesorhizobium sp.]|nr:MAG: hypothetical protein EOR46_30700 [Mesorhizobium sp.]RWK61003.1 MAG: hypothetical protein EOR54_33780 [Mesorhizobium sp.]RWK70231.1 MAG: hypothetical protein EOR50_34175 [Mesorhizobium sp.]RWK74167.1 MAG: hypothetical protein EOR51_34460 [Mesorhizobium sp.]RWK98980.1 MAG: hypothetical protein EOR55_33905 [Mesorhizobium sp.]